MSFWDVTNPKKPKGIKDPDAVLDYPISFADWLADISDTYLSHAVAVTGGLVLDSSIQSSGIITPTLSAGTVGETATFTITITTVSGRIDERTFYLKIQER
jgi:hypothetical protein